MVRRVGFGNKDNEESIQATADLIKSRLDSAAEPINAEPMSGPARVFTILFLGVWLLGWSGGILFAVFALFNGNDFSKFFLIFWIIIASAGWLFAVKALRALLRGETISGAPIKARKARGSKTRNTPATRADSAPNKPASVQDRDTSIRATQLSRNVLTFKVAKIVVAVLIAIRIESTIMFIILFFWAGKEMWSLLQKVPTSTGPDK